MKTYSVDVVCRNCGNESHVDIEVGTTVSSSRCPNCKCFNLARITAMNEKQNMLSSSMACIPG